MMPLLLALGFEGERRAISRTAVAALGHFLYRGRHLLRAQEGHRDRVSRRSGVVPLASVLSDVRRAAAGVGHDADARLSACELSPVERPDRLWFAQSRHRARARVVRACSPSRPGAPGVAPTTILLACWLGVAALLVWATAFLNHTAVHPYFMARLLGHSGNRRDDPCCHSLLEQSLVRA